MPEDTGGYQSHRTCPAWPEAYKSQVGREPSGTGQGILLRGQQGLLEEGWKGPLQGVLGILYFYFLYFYIRDCRYFDSPVTIFCAAILR